MICIIYFWIKSKYTGVELFKNLSRTIVQKVVGRLFSLLNHIIYIPIHCVYQDNKINFMTQLKFHFVNDLLYKSIGQF